jgi:hypothetical protein
MPVQDQKRKTNLERTRRGFGWALVLWPTFFVIFAIAVFTAMVGLMFGLLFVSFCSICLFVAILFRGFRCESCDRFLFIATRPIAYLRPRWMPTYLSYPRAHFCPYCGYDLASEAGVEESFAPESTPVPERAPGPAVLDADGLPTPPPDAV